MKRTLGRSGIEFSALGMGRWAIGSTFWSGETPLDWGQVDDEESIRAIHRAFNLGVNFNNTANDVRGEKRPAWMKYFIDGEPNPEWATKRDAICDILTSKGRSIAQGSLAWNWARSEKALPIPDFRTVAQVQENAKAMQFDPLTLDQMRDIDKLLERE